MSFALPSAFASAGKPVPAMNVPSLPKTARATRVPLRLGSVIPDKTP